MRKILSIAFLAWLFGACSVPVEEFNQPATFWYERIIQSLANGNLERADGYFNALQGEHLASPLIADALLMLANAHMENNEHLLAGYFINEYKTRFSTTKNIAFVSFWEVKANYYAFSNYSKDQGFINDNINEISQFITLNSENKYMPYISHILTSFKLARFEMNESIMRIYRHKDKDLAIEKYQKDNDDLGVGEIEFTPSHIPWYVRIFSW